MGKTHRNSDGHFFTETNKSSKMKKENKKRKTPSNYYIKNKPGDDYDVDFFDDKYSE